MVREARVFVEKEAEDQLDLVFGEQLLRTR